VISAVFRSQFLVHSSELEFPTSAGESTIWTFNQVKVGEGVGFLRRCF
jgi:hypothetical protein